MLTLNLKERQKIDDLKLFEENWNFGNYLKIEILKKNWKLESWKLNLRIGIFEIKFERNWNFGNYLRIGVLEIKFKD